MRKLLLLTTFFSLTPVILLIALLALLTLFHHSKDFLALKSPYQHTVAFAALPSAQNTFSDTIKSADARAEILTQFFTKYNSPLKPYAAEFVKKAEEYQLDFRLLPAIAMQETNLCLKSHEDSYNCWGFGVHGGKYLYFDNYPQAIDTISKTLAERYRDQHGLVTPEEIQKLYNPTNTDAWATSVDHFMDTLQ